MDPTLIVTTHTTKFILPLFVKENTKYKDIQDTFINAYIADKKLPEYDNCIFLVFSGHDYYNAENKETKYIKDNYKNIFINMELDNHDVIYIYDIPEEYLEDYFNFLQGNYKKFKESTKEKILKFWQVSEKSLLYNILYNNKDFDFEKHIKENIKNTSPWKNLYKKLLKYNCQTPDLEKEIYGIGIN
ncbi:MAG: hypothetical protein ACOC3V_01755 [bacterium]